MLIKQEKPNYSTIVFQKWTMYIQTKQREEEKSNILKKETKVQGREQRLSKGFRWTAFN